MSLTPEAGFLDEVTHDSFVLGPGYDRPYQLDPAVREPKSIQLYQHLNLKSCIWTFDAYYDMTELIDVCGGSVTADFQVRGTSRALPPIPGLSQFSGTALRCTQVLLLCSVQVERGFSPLSPGREQCCVHLFIFLGVTQVLFS